MSSFFLECFLSDQLKFRFFSLLQNFIHLQKKPNPMKNRRLVLLSIALILTLGSFSRITGNDSIRAIQFLSIFTIGAISALLIRELAEKFKGNK